MPAIDENLAWGHFFVSLKRIQAELRRIYSDEFLTVRVGCDDLLDMLTFHATWDHAKGGKHKTYTVSKEDFERSDASIIEYIIFKLSPKENYAPTRSD